MQTFRNSTYHIHRLSLSWTSSDKIPSHSTYWLRYSVCRLNFTVTTPAIRCASGGKSCTGNGHRVLGTPAMLRWRPQAHKIDLATKDSLACFQCDNCAREPYKPVYRTNAALLISSHEILNLEFCFDFRSQMIFCCDQLPLNHLLLYGVGVVPRKVQAHAGALLHEAVGSEGAPPSLLHTEHRFSGEGGRASHRAHCCSTWYSLANLRIEPGDGFLAMMTT